MLPARDGKGNPEFSNADSALFGNVRTHSGSGSGSGSGSSSGLPFNLQVDQDDDIVIVISGISARLPESDNLQEFSDNLFNGVDMTTDDGRRWTTGLYGLPSRSGKLKQINKFDATFFGVHAKQATLMDPQLRMLLELTYEAILDAGENPSSLRGSRTGVFIGVTESESDEVWASNPAEVNGYGLTGCHRAMFANRVSFTFDLKGPSFALDAAGSSSLCALDRAVSAIRMGHCDAAIIGGVNLSLKPANSLQFQRLGMLSPEGTCKAFDGAGNGYVRSEAGVVVYIRKGAFAKRSYATILHTKATADGFKEDGITMPSGSAQKTLLEEIYAEAGVSPSQVGYVEAHGTGSKGEDTEELNAIAEVFCKERDKSSGPLLVGSVKSNMGHSEPASGLCSIAKVILAMQKGVIPGNLHFKNPNPDIPALHDGRIKVVTQNTPWEGGLLGVNSFGFGGTNVHVILKPNPKTVPRVIPNSLSIPLLIPLLIPASGRTREAVEFTLKQFSSRQPRDLELASLLQGICREEITGHEYRGYAVIQGDQVDLDVAPSARQKVGGTPPVWFIFTGMGSQWCGMGRDLLHFQVFAASIARSAQTLLPHDFDLHDILLHGNEETFENVLKSCVSIVSIQVGLVDLLRSLRVTPDGIIGHSVGELGCAYADGCFTAEQTVMAAYTRGKTILELKSPPGGMAAVGLSWAEAKIRCPADIFPACHNAKDSVSVSGPIASIRSFVQELKADGIFAKEVNSNGQAFHSKYVAGAGPKLAETLLEIIGEPQVRSEKWISSSIPEASWDSDLARTCSAEYHTNNMLSPVLFQEALAHVPAHALVVEIAPHGLLQAILKRSLSPSCTIVGLMHRTSPNNSAYFLNSVGKMFNAGIQPDIGAMYAKMEFPVSIRASLISPLIKWDHSISWDVANFNKVGSKSGETVIEVSLTSELDEFYAGHKIDGRILFPATGYMLLLWKTFAKLRGSTFEQLPVVFENLSFQRATILTKDGSVKFLINILDGTGEFQIQEGDSVAVSGIIRLPEDVDAEMLCHLKPLQIPTDNSGQTYIPLSRRDAYQELRLRGYEYAGIFQGLRSVDNEGAWAKLAWEGNWVSFLDTMLQFAILSKPHRALYLPTRIQRVTLDPKAFSEFLLANPEATTNSNQVPVLNYKNLNVIKCPGVEMRGLKASMAPRRQGSQASPKLEEYTFTPYFDDVTGSASTPVEKVVRLCVDIALENSSAPKFKVSEVILHSATNSVASIAEDVLLGHPLCDCEVTVLTTKDNSSSNTFKELLENAYNSKIKIVLKEDAGKLVPEKGAHLVILDDETLIAQSASSLKDQGFLLLRTQTAVTSAPKELTPVGHKLSNGGQWYLYRKKQVQALPNPTGVFTPTTIATTYTNYAWVEDLKAAMKRAAEEPADSPLIYLVSQNEPQNGILGLVNCLKQEPGGNKIRCFFVRDERWSSTTPTLNFREPDSQLKSVLERDLLMNVFENGVWGSYRHFPLAAGKSSALPSVQHAYINSLVPGDLSSLRWIQGPLKTFKAEEQTTTSELCSVYYAPLNFRDIMLATGKLPADALPGNLAMEDCVLGLEFSGRNSKGRRVMGCVAARGLATTLLADPTFMWEVPEGWSLEEAATVPVVYSTAYYALLVRGQMQPGDSVLIHSGSGGVGQAAISIALSMQCKVFTTVGSPEKQALLKKLFPRLKDSSFANSRDCSFEQHIMEETEGRGVDLVLNSLAGDRLQASVRCLAQHGRFLEIGKFDLSNNTPLGMSVFLRNVIFHGILLDALFDQDSAHRRTVVNLVAEGIKSGTVRPLPCSTFSDEQIEEAFRFMASGKHIGKVLLKIRSEEHDWGVEKVVKAIPRSYLDSDKSYVIIGGLGGFGLELAGWLIERGAKKLVLASRSGVTTGYQDLCLRKWREDGVTVAAPKADVTTSQGAEDLLKNVIESLGPLGGIFNLAMVLRDAFIENQSPSDFEAVAKPKIDATLHLDRVSRILASEMEYFVVFSSVSCGRGNAGQSNYGFANSVMERICEARRKDGFSGLAIQWGAIGDVGVVQESMGGNETVVGGTLPQRIQSCFNALDTFLQQTKATVASMVLADKSGGKKDDGGKSISLAEGVAHILGIKDVSKVNPGTSLAELGMDSLMGVEVKQLMERSQDVVLSMNKIRQLTFGQLGEIEAGSGGEEESKRRSSVGQV